MRKSRKTLPTKNEFMDKMISGECDRLKELLLKKNRDYNNSLHSTPILFDMDPATGIKARINDKLNRIRQVGLNDKTEDTVDDLIGYLIHLQIANKLIPKQ
jgi:hypothetical protein